MSTSTLFPLSNDFFLFALLLWLGYLLFLEFIGDYLPSKIPVSTSGKEGKSIMKMVTGKRRHVIPKKCRPLLCPPVYSSSVSRRMLYMDMQSLAKYIPRNVCVATTVENDLTENVRKRSASVSQNTHRKSITAAHNQHPDLSTASISPDTTPTKSSSSARMSISTDVNADLEICKKVMFPFPAGCDPNGNEAKYLLQKFPVLSRPDVVRYLVARKGNVQAAEEMIEKCLAWRSSVFPLKRKDALAAFQTKCFFPYGRAKDGSPVVYMRGGLYDSTKATPEQYVLAAAYTIDWSLRQYPDQTNVTVLVNTVIIPGGPNQSADTNFIKLFIQVLSDNYPERLKRLAIFPFPWYGRAIWGVLKVFVDKRTQDKVMLLSSANTGIPNELKEFMDPSEMPEFCGGTCTKPIVDLIETLD